MLTVSPLSSTSQAVDYYSNYYVQENAGQGEWFGKGAALLGLKGNAKLEDFIKVLEGKLSSDYVMPTTTDHRRPGYDLTFSAPKSVSILALVANDQRILDAHRTAVNRTLEYLEKNFAATRVKSKGKIDVEKTDNLLVAKFEHVESRALDPELHTHAIVMNATLRMDHKWRTLYFDSVYDNKMLLGVIYRGELAQSLMKLGYEITQISEKGLFELKDFPQGMIKLLSKRREQITTELKNQGFKSSKAAQIANFATRDSKVKVDLKDLQTAWDQELASNGFNLNQLQQYINQAKERGPITPANPYYLAVQAVRLTAKDLGDWHGAFTIKQLMKHAGWFNVSNCSPELLEKAIAEQFKSGELLYLTADLCTTQTARDLEIVNIANMLQGKNKAYPMFSKVSAAYLAKKSTDLKQMQIALKNLLTNNDQQTVVTTKNPTNYTETMKLFIEIACNYKFNPIGLTQTTTRKESLKAELGLKRTQTIAGFLTSCSYRAEKVNQNPGALQHRSRSKQIWILDLHSKISSSQVNALQAYAKEFGCRIIWANNSHKPQAAISTFLKHGIQELCLDNKLHNQKVNNYVSALISHPQPNKIDFNNTIDQNDWQKNTANALVHWSIFKHQQYDAVFSLKKVQLDLFSLGITVPKEVLQQELDKKVQRSLITIDKDLVTTKNNVELEQACLELVVKQKQTMPPIASNISLSKELTMGQQNAIKLVLTTCDQVVGVQGVAGSGKTTVLRSLNKLCTQHSIEIIGITPTASAKERLQEGSKDLASKDLLLKAGIKSFTVSKFLIETEKLLNIDANLAQLEYGTNKLLVLDEASFVSTAEMFAILTKVQELNGRLVVMGDNRQLSSVEAGRIFYLMLGSNMQSVAMTENVRFKSAQTLHIMQHIYKNQIPEALEKLGKSLIEIPNHQERLMKMAELYLAKTPEERLNTILITPEHSDRKFVNHQIRQGLKQSNQLMGIKVDCHNLTSVKLTKAEQQKIYYFKEQDFVVFLKSAKELLVENNHYYLIKHKDLEKQSLTLEDSVTKEQIIWLPAKGGCTLQVYRQEAQELMVNEQIRWLKNNEALGLANGQTATIKSIDNEINATILLDNNKEICLNFKEFSNQHWDYAYAATTFVAQGKDKLATIALAKGGYSKEVLTKDIKVGNVITAKQGIISNNSCNFKLVKVAEINKDYTATAHDREGNALTLDLKKSPTNAYGKGQAIWSCYPDPTTRKGSNIPKLTSVAEFLVSVTRGDEVTLLVDHIESYQHALEQNLYARASALEFLDPKNQEVKAKVDCMTKNITGIAEKLNKSAIKPSNTKESLQQKSFLVTADQIIAKLHNNILQHTSTWLGKPQKITNQEARWGKKGSLVVKLSDAKAGFWHDFEKGTGGKNLLSLYMERFNLDFKQAMQELSGALNLHHENKLFTQILPNNKLRSNKNLTIDLKKINYITKIYNSGKEITDTLAAKYLQEFRKITGNIPNDFRFCAKLKHPDLHKLVPALMAPIKNAEDQIQGLVRIFLNPDGNKLNAGYINNQGLHQPATVKANLGSMVNGAVIINPGEKPSTMYIAEGLETALSIAQVTKPVERVVAALSVTNLKNVPIPPDVKKIVLCADYDGANSISSKAIGSAAKFYQERGLEVKIAYPEKIPGLEKRDFNDVLKHFGADSILRSTQNANSINLQVANDQQTVSTAMFKSMKLNQSDRELSL